MAIVGIGVYGRTKEAFVEELQSKEIDTVIDVRLFRGMRGPKYRWANSKSLQQLLKSTGIGYQHRKELAPPKELRAIQKTFDLSSKISKSDRYALHPDFAQAYRNQILPLLTEEYVGGLPMHSALLCVENSDEACHRSVLLRLISELSNA